MTNFSYPIKKPDNYKFHQYKLVGDKVVIQKQFCACRFIVSSSPRTFKSAQTSMVEWLETDRAKWLLENSADQPFYDYYKCAMRNSVIFEVFYILEEKMLTLYHLKFS